MHFVGSPYFKTLFLRHTITLKFISTAKREKKKKKVKQNSIPAPPGDEATGLSPTLPIFISFPWASVDGICCSLPFAAKRHPPPVPVWTLRLGSHSASGTLHLIMPFGFVCRTLFQTPVMVFRYFHTTSMRKDGSKEKEQSFHQVAGTELEIYFALFIYEGLCSTGYRSLS